MQRAITTNRVAHLMGEDAPTTQKGSETLVEAPILPGSETSPVNTPTPENGPGDEDEDEEFEEDEEDDEDGGYDDEDDRAQGSGSGGDNGDGLGYDDGRDDDEDEDEDSDDEDSLEAKNIKDKLRIAKDGTSGLTEGRVIFVRDPANPEKVYMVASVENILPDEIIATDGSQMWMADFIFRLKGRGYTDPTDTIKKVNPNVFKKDNWEGRTNGGPNL